MVGFVPGIFLHQLPTFYLGPSRSSAALRLHVGSGPALLVMATALLLLQAGISDCIASFGSTLCLSPVRQ